MNADDGPFPDTGLARPAADRTTVADVEQVRASDKVTAGNRVTACYDCDVVYKKTPESWEQCPRCGEGLRDMEVGK